MDIAQDELPPRPVGARYSACDICGIVWVIFWCMLVPLMLLFVALSFIAFETFLQEPYYTVAIDSVSGLDLVLGGRHALDPEFNLTFRVGSHGFWVRECAEHGMRAEVSYRGVSLASGVATTEEKICAGPRKAVDLPVVVRGAGVYLPGSMLDGLAGDLRNGAPQVFDVDLRLQGKHDKYTCGPRRVGDSCALRTECAHISGVRRACQT